jgi:DNA replication protein DnaC
MSEWHGTQYWRNLPVDDRLGVAGIPPLLEGSRVSNYDWDREEDVRPKVERWVSSFKSNRTNGVGLFIYGKSGCGKSHLASALLRGSISGHGQCGRFITASEYLRALDNERYNDGVLSDEYDEEHLISYLRTVYDVVVVDDLSSMRSTEYARREISDLLASRVSRRLVTIFTSLLPAPSTKDFVSPQFYSLVRSTCLSVPLTSGDYRGRPDGG